ncbi:TKL IRAK kinase [Brachionus plicatilis]|uniref:TKL IRAK kinase n=1 Tax=Brachionus plicatilis TaxID=10195 RepID=A0A3M7QGE7_BRAPC|nr:TKL IRAK kinase [Brachionus plicatilis]
MSVMSLESIDNAIKNIENAHSEKSLLLKNSIINPIFGFLFQSTGILSNLRFYSAEIEIEKDSEIRQYLLDSSMNDFYKLLVELFPSPSGVLSISKTDDIQNFAYTASKSKCKTLEFMAIMFIKTLNPKYQLSKESVFKNFIRIEELFLSSSTLFGPQNTRILKLLVIHAFVINFADSQQDLEQYLGHVVKKVHFDGSFDIYSFPIDIMQEIVRLNKDYTSFPYSKINKPPSNEFIPIFDRSKREKENPFILQNTFPDCADVLLLHICNCLLFDPNTGTYSTATLPKSSDIAKFYSNHRNIFAICQEIRKEWSRVVQGLGDFNSETKKTPYNTNLIVYKREMRNEIKSGLINMMNVLLKIFELDHKEFWSNFRGIKDIEGKVKRLFKLITPSFEARKVKVKIYEENFTEFNSMSRKDFCGDFNLIFIQPNGTEITMNIKHFTYHAQMTFVSSENKNFDDQYLCKFYDSVPSTLPLIFLKKYIEPSLAARPMHLETHMLQNIFFSGNIDTNEYKRAILIKTFTYLIEEEYVIEDKTRNQTIELLKKIVINILSSVALRDPAIKKKFSSFLVYQENLSQEETIKFWIDSFKIERPAIYRLWNKKILTLNNQEVKITFAEINGKLVKVLFDTLQNCTHLKSLQLKEIPEKIKKMVYSEMGRLKKLTNLDISDNYIGLKSAVGLSTSLEKLDNLEKLNLANTLTSFLFCQKMQATLMETIDKSKSSFFNAISKLKNLKVLNLSNNDLCLEKNVHLPSLIGNMTELQVLHIGGNSICEIKDVQALCTTLTELSHLTIIDLSENAIGSDGTKLVSMALAKLPNLTVFRYSGNNAGVMGGVDLAKSLGSLKNLIEVDLSCNSMMEYGTQAVVESLHNSPNIQRLFLSNNTLKTCGAKKISTALGKLVSLEELDLGRNDITDKGLITLLEHIKSLANLCSLDFSFNSLENEGAIALAGCIHQFPKLSVLRLSGNQIGTRGASFLFKSLDTLSRIQTIDVAKNEIDCEILNSVFDILETSESLTAIYLKRNNIGKEQKESILNKILGITNKVEHDISVADSDENDSDIEFR